MAKSAETATTQSGSARLHKEASQFTPGGVHAQIRVAEPALAMERSKGAYMWDVDGNRYIDNHAAYAPIILGHCYDAVDDRVIEAIKSTDLYGVGTTSLEVALCKKVVEHVPSAEQVSLCVTGSEATFQAIRLSRAVTGRQKVIKFQGCYHGWHDYVLRNVLSAPDKVGKRDPGSAGMLEAAIDNTIVCTFNDLEEVEAAIKANPGEVASIILEPVPHNIGCILPKQEFLEGLRKICDREGIVLTFDEVISGWRHSIGGYQAVCGVTPDLTTMGKAMGNGFPIAAIAGKREMMQRFNTRPGGDVFFVGTYNGHASCLAASLATIEVMETAGVHNHIFRLGDRMRAGMQEIITRKGYKCTVAGFGSVYTTYFMENNRIENYSDVLRNDAELYMNYRRELIKRGVFEIPLNLKRCHIGFSHTEADIDEALQAAEESMAAVHDARARGEY